MTESEAKQNIIAYVTMESENLPIGMGKAFDVAIRALEEVQQYHAIGTPEECQAAMEKHTAKRPREYEDKYYGCPTCGNVLLHKWEKYPDKLMDKSNGLPYCLGCGQKLDWSDEG